MEIILNFLSHHSTSKTYGTYRLFFVLFLGPLYRVMGPRSSQGPGLWVIASSWFLGPLYRSWTLSFIWSGSSLWSWVLPKGFWVLGPHMIWLLSIGSWVLCIGSWILGSHRVLDPLYRVLGRSFGPRRILSPPS